MSDATGHQRGGHRHCMWMVLCYVAAIGQSGEPVNQPVGTRLVLLAHSVFRVRHRGEHGVYVPIH